jgi:hypothetical protein
MVASLQRIVIDLRAEEMVLRVLYRSDGISNPGTVRRRREVTGLAKSGLRDALEALDSEAGAECVGTSGFTTREDVLLATTSPDESKLVKKGA